MKKHIKEYYIYDEIALNIEKKYNVNLKDYSSKNGVNQDKKLNFFNYLLKNVFSQ